MPCKLSPHVYVQRANLQDFKNIPHYQTVFYVSEIVFAMLKGSRQKSYF